MAATSARAADADPAAEMAEAARRFLNSLDDAQKAEAQYDLKADHRTRWHYFPDAFIRPDARRWGVSLKNMTPIQRHLAQALVATGLTPQGHSTALTLMALEQILHEQQNNNPIRDPDLYYVAVYGEPGAEGRWMWRFEGHHISLNYTIDNGKIVSATPSFFGVNPAKIVDGPLAGLEALEAEQSLARAFVKSLNDEQRAAAKVADTPPRDVLTKQDRRMSRETFPTDAGLAFDQLNAEQQQALRKLIRVYTSKHRADVLAHSGVEASFDEGADMRFGWAGGTEPGDEHYYRIQTPRFVIEYCNVQDGANHFHTVWRDYDGDFGGDAD